MSERCKMNIVRSRARCFTLGVSLFALLCLTGCNTPKEDLMKFDSYIARANFRAACDFADKEIHSSPTPKAEDLLWTLQLGALERVRSEGDYTRSTRYFDRAEEMLKYFDQKNRAGDVLGSLVASDNLAPYMGEEYDGIMVNTYKALNFMSQREMDLARVEFNRAIERQRRATEKYSREIRKLDEEMRENSEERKLARATADSDKVKERLARAYPELDTFQAYPDFVNPFTTYLAAIYYNLTHDSEKAEYQLKVAASMVRNNPYIAEDLSLIEQAPSNGPSPFDGSIWVIFENGLGPVREEFRLDIPLFIATDRIQYVGIALPKLETRPAPYPYIELTAAGQMHRTSLVADMDRVVKTEFKKDYPATLARAIVSATGKAALQYTITENKSSEAQVASWLFAAYSMLSTAADVRIWTTLPKNFQIARFPIPADRALTISAPGLTPINVKIPDCTNAVVYIKTMTRNSPLVYDVMTF